MIDHLYAIVREKSNYRCKQYSFHQNVEVQITGRPRSTQQRIAAIDMLMYVYQREIGSVFRHLPR